MATAAATGNLQTFEYAPTTGRPLRPRPALRAGHGQQDALGPARRPQRTREIGVRIALGAQVRDVLWLVLGTGIRLAAAGAVIGIIGSLALTQLLRSAVPQLPTRGPWPIVVVTTALIGVTLFASYLPARRATRVDPMTTLTE